MQVLNRFNDIAMGARFITVTMPAKALLKDDTSNSERALLL